MAFMVFDLVTITKPLGCSNCKLDVCVLKPFNVFCTPICQLKDFKAVTVTDG